MSSNFLKFEHLGGTYSLLAHFLMKKEVGLNFTPVAGVKFKGIRQIFTPTTQVKLTPTARVNSTSFARIKWPV